MINDEEIIIQKIDQLCQEDNDRNNYYMLRYDDLLKASGLDEEDFIRQLLKMKEKYAFDFNGQIISTSSAKHFVHDQYIENTFRIDMVRNKEI